MVEATILSRKIIKPCSSTPSSLIRHDLSLFDHISTPAYAPFAAFYSKPANDHYNNISQILENSLSTVLASYYPFAGRLVEEKKLSYVNCNDDGAEFLNVRINCPMNEVLNNPYNDAINVAFPQNLPWNSSFTGSLLVAQLSHFDCGGLSVSVCISHKLIDGYSLSKFLNDWAAIARDQLDFKPSVQFDAASFFPITTIIDRDPPYIPDFVREPQRCVSRRYNFPSSSLDRLKDYVSKNSPVQNPTRIEVATGLIHRCISMVNFSEFKPSLMSHAMNLRPPLINTIGNLVSFFSYAAETEDEVQVSLLAAKLREAKQHIRDKLKDMNSKDQIAAHALESMKEAVYTSFERIFCSTLCNLGLNRTDFGWGNPIRTASPTHPMKNNVIFLDDPSGDGIVAIITLKETDMLKFQDNQELLKFASPDVHLNANNGGK